MGEVYRAHDTRLHRIVALKVLPAASFADPESKRRFLQEAQAASALNHPNIVTLHDIASDGGTDFLVLEYVPGNPLGRMIPPGGLPLSDVLRYGTQIASALAVAHAAGIVHRDIKPANVMITPDSQVKVLDFGVAKLMERVAGPDTETRSAVARTMSGVVVGTHSYMSPEQTRGDAVDGRSDLFSLGLVLYQMATGRLPLPGASLGQVLLEGTTTRIEPPSRLRRAIPRVLDDVILRLLQFDLTRRFQTAAELRDALIGLAAPPRRLSPRILAPAVAMGVLSLVVSGLWFVGRQRGFTTPEPLQYIRLTDFPDAVHSPALSPDGKMLAFVRGAEPFLFGPGELYVKILPDGQPVALTRDGTQKMAPAFTADGSRIVFTSAGFSSLSVPVAGGTPAGFMPNAAGLRWIAPGQVMFSEMRKAPNMGVVAASESRGQARDVYVPASPQGMAHFSEQSPDGHWVLIVEMDTNAWLPCRVVPFDGTSTGRQVGPPGAGCTSAAWSPDGRWMYFTATLNSESHLWRQRFPDGSPEQLTSGVNQERGVVVDPDGRSVITSLGANQSAIWFHGPTGDRPISVEGYSYRPVMSPDGSKVFYLVRRPARRSFSIGELWATDLETGRNDRVLPEFLVRAFHISPDGRLVVFDAFDETDRSRIWIAPTIEVRHLAD